MKEKKGFGEYLVFVIATHGEAEVLILNFYHVGDVGAVYR